MTRIVEEGLTLSGLGKRSFYFPETHGTQQVSDILAGRTYPGLEAIGPIETILDLGANIGAASLFFKSVYPDATLHAVEPSTAAFPLLQKNLADLPAVHLHRLALLDRDGEAPLFAGNHRSSTSSLARSTEAKGEPETVPVMAAGSFADTQGLGRIDILKIDTEGAERPILMSLGDRLALTRVVYLEIHSDDDRRLIDKMLAPTHLLARARIPCPHRGEFTYVNRSTEYVQRWLHAMIRVQ